MVGQKSASLSNRNLTCTWSAAAHLAHSCWEHDVDLRRPKLRMKSLPIGDMHLASVGKHIQAVAVDPSGNALLVLGRSIIDFIGQSDVAVLTGNVDDGPF